MGQFEQQTLFYLKNSAGEWYYQDSNGDVQTTSTETPLRHAPEGWGDTELNWTRSTEYWGLFRKTSTSFLFHKDAHVILSYIRTTQGTEGYCKLVIKKRDMANLSPNVTLNNFYDCELDFSQAKIKRKTTEIPAMEGGVRDLFSAYENTEFEIPLGVDAATIRFDGITLQAKLTFGNIGSTQYGASIGGTPAEVYVPMVFLGQDGDYPVGTTQDIQLLPGTTFVDNTNNATQWFFKSLRTQTITLSYYGYISYSLDGGATGSVVPTMFTRVFVDESSTFSAPINSNVQVWSGSDVNPGDTNLELVQFTETYNLVEGNIMCISTGALQPYGPVFGSLFGIQFIETNPPDEEHTIKTVFQLPATKAKAYTYRTLLDKLIALMTEGTAVFGSAYFFNINPIVDNLIYNTYVTSGTAIREIADPKLKTSWAAAWKDAKSQWCLGVSVDTTSVSVEHLSHFLDKDIEIYDFGQVSFAEYKTFDPVQYSNIKVGYANQEYDGINGRYESNTTQSYKLPKKRATATFDLQGSYRYDPYGLELFRDKLRDKDSTDNRADNEIFVVETRSGTVKFPARPQNDSPNYATYNDAEINFLLKKYYNIMFSPKRKLLRNAPHVLATMHLTNGNVEYLTTDKLDELESDLGFGVIVEKGSIDISDAFWGDLVYLPIIFSFEAVIPDSLYTAITAEPNGYMSFSYGGYDFKGFPMDIKYTERNQAYKVELLAHPDTDMNDVFEAFK